MPSNFDSSLKLKYESDMMYSYAVLETDNNVGYVSYQAEMIIQNPCTGFVPLHVRQQDEKVKMYYNITSKLSLSQYLSRKILSRMEFLDLIRNINKSLMNYFSYYLDISCFILDKDLMFISPSTGEISLIYVPISRDKDFINDYKTFLTDLIINVINLDEKISDNFLQKILSHLKMEELNLNDFNRFVNDLRMKGFEPIGEDFPKYINDRTKVNGKLHNDSTSPVYNHSGTKHVSKDRRSLLSIIAFQAIIILTAVIICMMLVVKKNADISTVLGVIIIASAADILFISKVNKKAGKEISRNKTEEEVGDIHKGKSEKNINSLIQRKVLKSKGKTEQDNMHHSPELLRSFDTVVIGAAARELPCLDGIGPYNSDKIIIDRDRLLIGRLKNYVDYIINNNMVGKVHAEIIKEGNLFFIKDLNSKNGTYVNGNRISCNEEHEIKENDRIRIANYEYIFRV